MFQCPNHLFSQYARFLVALGSLHIIPNFTLKLENFYLVTLSMLTFLSSCTRFGCHNIRSWERKKEKWMRNFFQATNLDEYGLLMETRIYHYLQLFKFASKLKRIVVEWKRNLEPWNSVHQYITHNIITALKHNHLLSNNSCDNYYITLYYTARAYCYWVNFLANYRGRIRLKNQMNN